VDEPVNQGYITEDANSENFIIAITTIIIVNILGILATEEAMIPG